MRGPIGPEVLFIPTYPSVTQIEWVCCQSNPIQLGIEDGLGIVDRSIPINIVVSGSKLLKSLQEGGPCQSSSRLSPIGATTIFKEMCGDEQLLKLNLLKSIVKDMYHPITYKHQKLFRFNE